MMHKGLGMVTGALHYYHAQGLYYITLNLIPHVNIKSSHHLPNKVVH
jgi:hypothetical protein